MSSVKSDLRLNPFLRTVSVTNVVTQKAICPFSPFNVDVNLWVRVQKSTGKHNIQGREKKGYFINSLDALYLLL